MPAQVGDLVQLVPWLNAPAHRYVPGVVVGDDGSTDRPLKVRLFPLDGRGGGSRHWWCFPHQLERVPRTAVGMTAEMVAKADQAVANMKQRLASASTSASASTAASASVAAAASTSASAPLEVGCWVQTTAASGSVRAGFLHSVRTTTKGRVLPLLVWLLGEWAFVAFQWDQVVRCDPPPGAPQRVLPPSPPLRVGDCVRVAPWLPTGPSTVQPGTAYTLVEEDGDRRFPLQLASACGAAWWAFPHQLERVATAAEASSTAAVKRRRDGSDAANG